MCWNLIHFSIKTQNQKYMHNKRHNCLERSCFVEILHACFEANFTHCQVSCVLITPPNSFVFSTNLKRKQIYIFLLSFLFLQPLSLIVSGRNHLPALPPPSWCEVMPRSCICLFSVQKPSKSDLCSCGRHLAAPSKETPERIKTCPGGEDALPSRVTEDYRRNDHLRFILFRV